MQNDQDKQLRIAFIKEASYQDLWVGGNNESIETLVLNSHLRIGPIGLLTRLNADFYIVQTSTSKAAKSFRLSQVPFLSDSVCRDIETGKSNDYIVSQTQRKPIDYTTSITDISFGSYDIVISVNLAIPVSVRETFRYVTWICMPGEGMIPVWANKWDFFITHICPTGTKPRGMLIDMPYTLIEPDFILRQFPNKRKKEGAYIEINSCPREKRSEWRQHIQGVDIIEMEGILCRYHPDNLNEHIQILSETKYFIKLGGRAVRGNSFLEAMSAGAICMQRLGDSEYGNVACHPYCYYTDIDALLSKLLEIENSSSLESEILNYQALYLENIMICVESQLMEAVRIKRLKPIREISSIKQKAGLRGRLIINSISTRWTIPRSVYSNDLKPLIE